MKVKILVIFIFISNYSFSQIDSSSLVNGINKYLSEDYVGAVSDLTNAIDLYPNDPNLYYKLGNAKRFLNDNPSAIYYLTKCINLCKSPFPDAFTCRGLAKMALEDYRGAIADYSEVIKLESDNSEAYFDRSLAHSHLEHWNSAVLDLNKSLQINAKNPNALFNRAIAYLALGKKALACIDLSKSGELGESKAYDMIKEYCK